MTAPTAPAFPGIQVEPFSRLDVDLVETKRRDALEKWQKFQSLFHGHPKGYVAHPAPKPKAKVVYSMVEALRNVEPLQKPSSKDEKISITDPGLMMFIYIDLHASTDPNGFDALASLKPSTPIHVGVVQAVTSTETNRYYTKLGAGADEKMLNLKTILPRHAVLDSVGENRLLPAYSQSCEVICTAGELQSRENMVGVELLFYDSPSTEASFQLTKDTMKNWSLGALGDATWNLTRFSRKTEFINWLVLYDPTSKETSFGRPFLDCRWTSEFTYVPQENVLIPTFFPITERVNVSVGDSRLSSTHLERPCKTIPHLDDYHHSANNLCREFVYYGDDIVYKMPAFVEADDLPEHEDKAGKLKLISKKVEPYA